LKWPELEIFQDGYEEKTYLFKAEHFEAVAKKAKALRRCRPESADRLKPYRYPAQDPPVDPPESTNDPPDDPEHV
jgi:hypothetical protein